jgi:sugar transferase (PEP-CTERM/EpsH1 system associated)
LVVHVIFRLATGGLENGLVNLINAMPADRYRHAIICLADTTEFQKRIARGGVAVIALEKRPGHDLRAYWRAWKTFRELKPAIVHTRNFPAMEYVMVALCAGVRGRIHGEHGRDTYDLDGSNRVYNRFRRLVRPFVNRFTTVSVDLAAWLRDTIGVEPDRIAQIYNGVDVARFRPASGRRIPIGPPGFAEPDSVIVGTIGRMQTVKNQTLLARAFIRLIEQEPKLRPVVRLVMVGDGPLRGEVANLLERAGLHDLAWLPGERQDIPDLLKQMDVFVLPSLVEGISNTVLEAMATGLPVVATDVGGTRELVRDGVTGGLVPSDDIDALTGRIRGYVVDKSLRERHGMAGRQRVEREYTIEVMVRKYMDVYDSVVAVTRRRRAGVYQPAMG